MGPARPWALLLGALGVVALLVGCGASREARASLGAGRQAMAQGAFREALEHLRTATRLAPNFAPAQLALGEAAEALGDRKSTRLNSSHGYISYAVFCLKKKKTIAEID